MTSANEQDPAGFLNDLGLDNLADGELPTGKYLGEVTASKVVPKKDGSKSWVITYTVRQPGSEFDGLTKDEWKSCNKMDSPQVKRFLRDRALSLGVPENELGNFRPSDVIGTPVFFTLARRGEYVNVTEVSLAPVASTGSSAGNGVPNPPAGNVAASMGLL